MTIGSFMVEIIDEDMHLVPEPHPNVPLQDIADKMEAILQEEYSYTILRQAVEEVCDDE